MYVMKKYLEQSSSFFWDASFYMFIYFSHLLSI